MRIRMHSALCGPTLLQSDEMNPLILHLFTQKPSTACFFVQGRRLGVQMGGNIITSKAKVALRIISLLFSSTKRQGLLNLLV